GARAGLAVRDPAQAPAQDLGGRREDLFLVGQGDAPDEVDAAGLPTRRCAHPHPLHSSPAPAEISRARPAPAPRRASEQLRDPRAPPASASRLQWTRSSGNERPVGIVPPHGPAFCGRISDSLGCVDQTAPTARRRAAGSRGAIRAAPIEVPQPVGPPSSSTLAVGAVPIWSTYTAYPPATRPASTSSSTRSR